MIFIIHVMLFFNTANQLASFVIWEAGIAMMALISFMFFWNFAYLVSASIRGMITGAKLKKIRLSNMRKARLNKFKRPKVKGSARGGPQRNIMVQSDFQVVDKLENSKDT